MRVADRQLAFWLFVLTFVTYAYFQAGGGWNQNSQFDLTRAIVERHTFAIDAYASNTGDVSRAAGLATAMNYLCAPALIVLAVTRKFRFVAGAIAPLVLLAIYQKICFGSFLTLSLTHEDQRFLTKGAAFGIFRLPSPDAILGIS